MNQSAQLKRLRYRFLIYGLATLLSGFYYLGFIPDLFWNNKEQVSLPHRLTLQEKPPFQVKSETLQQLSLWGPLHIQQENTEILINLKNVRLKTGFVRGEVSLLKARKLESKPGSLKSGREIANYLEKQQKLSRRRILEVFSFPFEFWLENYEQKSSLNSQQESEVQIPSPGSYYVLLESSSNQSIESARDFKVGIRMGTAKFFWAGIAVLIFFALSLYNLIYLISSSKQRKIDV